MSNYTSIRVKKSTVEMLNDVKKDLGCTHEFLILKMYKVYMGYDVHGGQ